MKKKLLSSLLMIAVLLLSGFASAGEATDFVKTKQAKLFEVIAQPKSAARQEKLRTMFDEILAYEELSKASLGKQWGERSATEQKEFSALLTELVRNNYKRNLLKMLDYNISYTGEKACPSDGGDDCPGGSILVTSRAKHKTDKREPDVEIDFRVQRIGGKLMIIDIVTERASLVKTYRSQFLRILKKDGYAALIQKMKTKLSDLEKETA
jgi:phospholipid transport system substrate-binding protein